MAVIPSQTPAEAVEVQTGSMEVEALKLNAAAQQLRPTIAGVWDLEVTTKAAWPQQDVNLLAHKDPSEESVLDGRDERVLLKLEDILLGGKYYKHRCTYSR